MKRLLKLSSSQKGASAMEFALVAPVFILLLIGIAQLGILFLANAGLNNALAEGARLATLHPRPTEADIKAKINATKFGLDPAKLATPTLTAGTASSSDYYNIQMSYVVQLNFIWFMPPPITLTQSRRVYLQPLPPV